MSENNLEKIDIEDDLEAALAAIIAKANSAGVKHPLVTITAAISSSSEEANLVAMRVCGGPIGTSDLFHTAMAILETVKKKFGELVEGGDGVETVH